MKQERNPTNGRKAFFWQVHMDRWSQGNLSRAEYCRQHGLPYWGMTYWAKKLERRTGDVRGQEASRSRNEVMAGGFGANEGLGSGMVQVGIVAVPEVREGSWEQERGGVRVLLPGNVSVDVDKGFSAETLTRVLAVLETR